jgi:hypothetical protein
MIIKYTKISHCKTLQNLPQIVFLVWKPSGSPVSEQKTKFLFSETLYAARGVIKIYNAGIVTRNRRIGSMITHWKYIFLKNKYIHMHM